ncbi:membrane bound O-acyl transferase family-domain-containing protein [Xylariaceae sp. FL0016]|nr:membrane bound O-acyl transferase family-domain-containing protein [Xylariaceae sp. FL0016]
MIPSNMDVLDTFLQSFYPALDDRLPLPRWYHPATFALAVTCSFFGYNKISTIVCCSLLFYLFLQRPYYTSGLPLGDFCFGAAPLVILLKLATFHASPPRYLGPKPGGRGVSIEDLPSLKQKLLWAVALQSTVRGIGWDWQVKGVPAHPEATSLPRWKWLEMQALRVVRHLILRAIALYTLGFCRVLQASSTSAQVIKLYDVAIAWSGAMWLYQSILILGSAGGFMTVSRGVDEPWQWPSMLGPLTEAWSVRQMWGVSYHQMFRRAFQEPSIKLTRFLGLKKGSLGSRYFQLYFVFALSAFYHFWGQFIVSRRDQGEWAFFMTQPLLITLEDFVQWNWAKVVGPVSCRSAHLRRFERVVGYVWTFACFSWTLTPHVRNRAGLGAAGKPAPLELGSRHATSFLRA